MRLIWRGRPRGALEQGLDGGRLEQRQLASGEPEAVGEVGVDLVAVEPGEMVAHDEALGERFVHRHGEAAPELGQPDQDEAQALLGIHGEVGQQAEVLEHVVAQMMGLVDDQPPAAAWPSVTRRETSLRIAWRAVARERSTGRPSSPCDLLVDVEHVAGGERDVVDAVEPRVEPGGEVAADGGLARADLAGEQADAAQADEMAEPGLGLAAGRGLEQPVGLGRGLEGQAGQGEVLLVHHSCSFLSLSLRMASGEGRGSGAGSAASISLAG